MSNDAIAVTGTVIKADRGFYRVRLDNGHEVLCHPSGRLRQKHIRCIPDDIVDVELSPYDLSRGRIVYRRK